MPEKDTISASSMPVTEDSILRDVRAMGVARGDILIVHTAMSKLGWVCGREATVVRALLRAVGPFGLLVAPTHSGDNSEPANWQHPPVPESWFVPVRENMPAYDRRVTASRAVGRVPECLRNYPGAKRSAHPHVSWAAKGFLAAWALRGHTWRKPCFGIGSPLGRFYRRGAKTLLIGVGYGNCTALHLAEALNPATPRINVGAAVQVHGMRRWVTWNDIDFDSDRFPQLGEAYELAGGVVTQGRIGQADCKLVPIRPLIDFGVTWLTENPPAPDSQSDTAQVDATPVATASVTATQADEQA